MKKDSEKKIIVTQIASSIGRKSVQEKNLFGLGLNKINKSKMLPDTPSIRGMVNKVKHLVKVKSVDTK